MYFHSQRISIKLLSLSCGLNRQRKANHYCSNVFTSQIFSKIKYICIRLNYIVLATSNCQVGESVFVEAPPPKLNPYATHVIGKTYNWQSFGEGQFPRNIKVEKCLPYSLRCLHGWKLNSQHSIGVGFANQVGFGAKHVWSCHGGHSMLQTSSTVASIGQEEGVLRLWLKTRD